MAKKVEIKADRYMYPRPALLVGANVKGRANFMAVGGGGVVNGGPPMIGVPIRHHQYTLEGIYENRTFAVNTPSADLITETDYCGVISGRKTDKAADCGFEVFYGPLKTAPMIGQCPLTLECRVVHILDLGVHAFVIGEVTGTWIDEDCLTEGRPDPVKIRPMVFDLEGGTYSGIGNVLGKAFSIGRDMLKKG